MSPPTNFQLSQELSAIKEQMRMSALQADRERHAMAKEISILKSEVQRLTRALLGEEDDIEPSFMDRAMKTIVAWERGSWLLSWSKALILGAGSITLAVVAVRNGITHFTGK